MKRSLLSVTLLTCMTALNAQTDRIPIPVNRCASYEVYQRMLHNDPTFARNQQSIEQFTEKFVNSGDVTMRTAAGTAVYTIPVVVYVVYNTTTENISNAQIQS